MVNRIYKATFVFLAIVALQVPSAFADSGVPLRTQNFMNPTETTVWSIKFSSAKRSFFENFLERGVFSDVARQKQKKLIDVLDDEYLELENKVAEIIQNAETDAYEVDWQKSDTIAVSEWHQVLITCGVVEKSGGLFGLFSERKAFVTMYFNPFFEKEWSGLSTPEVLEIERQTQVIQICNFLKIPVVL